MMIWLHVLAYAAALATSGCLPAQKDTADSAAIPELELVRAYPVEAPHLLEPSGLTMTDGVLYTVADKVDHTIYRIRLGEETAELSPAIRFTPPDRRTMDWEGITTDRGGSFYLISEQRGRLLQVTSDGTATWASPDLRPAARELGLFAKNNAGFEGLAWLGPNHWLGAAEREPRGLVEWTGIDETVRAEAWLHEDSPYKQALPLLRLPDFSGLHADEGKVYALFRNAHLLIRMEKSDGKWVEKAAWSYRHIETDPRWAYRAQTYGQAEGLVVSGQDVYLIFDNNLGPRMHDSTDRRSLLVHARIPDSGGD